MHLRGDQEAGWIQPADCCGENGNRAAQRLRLMIQSWEEVAGAGTQRKMEAFLPGNEVHRVWRYLKEARERLPQFGGVVAH